MSKTPQFTFQGSDLVLNVVNTSEDLVYSLLKSSKGCPIKSNPKIHFGKILGEGAGGAPVSEVTIDGFGTRLMVSKTFDVPVKKHKLTNPTSFDSILKQNNHIPPKLIIHANPGLKGKLLKAGSKVCIPKPIQECKTTEGVSFPRFDGRGFTNVHPGSYLCDDERYSEYYIGVLCGKLYRGLPIGGTCVAHSINFIEVIGFTTCAEKCDIKQYLFMDKIDGTVRKSKFKNKIYDSLYVQNLISLFFIQRAFTLQHGDLHTDNLFYQKVTEDMEYKGKKLYDADYFEYNVNGTRFYVPNHKVLLKIGDFGISVKYSHPVVGNKTVVESGYSGYFGFAGIPNWFSSSYDVLFSTNDMTNYSNLAEDVMNAISTKISYPVLDPKYKRPIPGMLEYADYVASPTAILMSDLFSKYRIKPEKGNVVLVGELKC